MADARLCWKGWKAIIDMLSFYTILGKIRAPLSYLPRPPWS